MPSSLGHSDQTTLCSLPVPPGAAVARALLAWGAGWGHPQAALQWVWDLSGVSGSLAQQRPAWGISLPMPVLFPRAVSGLGHRPLPGVCGQVVWNSQVSLS